jgi:3-deoxy-D-manno-octulosonic-acid transferase
MQRRLYSLLLYLVLVPAMLRQWWRGWRDASQRDSVRARLALGLEPRADSPLWLHAASVGELRALAALLHVMQPREPVLITSSTPTGLARARALFEGKGYAVQAAPWDLPGATRRFIARMRPRALVIVETELWPNLLAGAASAGIPVALLSARLSERSLCRYRALAASMMREAVRSLRIIACQSEADRGRFLQLGADADRVQVTGNVKFDLPVDAGLPARGRALRVAWAPQRPLWVAGSTHPGEEELLLAAHRQLMDAARARAALAPVLALVPRRPERFEAVARWLQEKQVRFARVTQGGSHAGHDAPDVILVDRMGVLPDWYAAADITFVGGSLVPIGGHNLLEAAAAGRPVLCGPHTFHAPEVTRALLEAGGARVVGNEGELRAQLAAWLEDPAAAAAVGAKAAAAVTANQGAARRALQLFRESASSARSGSG